MIDLPKSLYDTDAKTQARLAEKFWDRITRPENDQDGCWLWLRGSTHKYGIIWNGPRIARAKFYAHRFSYELHSGERIPENMCVCHECDTPRCVNPAHLFLGTHGDNIRDCLAKGRFRPGIGENSGHAKFTNAQVRELKERPDLVRGNYAAIARELGVTAAMVRDIAVGRTWSHI